MKGRDIPKKGTRNRFHSYSVPVSAASPTQKAGMAKAGEGQTPAKDTPSKTRVGVRKGDNS